MNTRKIDKIILHCTATKEGQDFKAADIKKWHVEGNKWKDIGYNFVIDLDGTIEFGRPINQVPAHTSGHNANSVGIVYIGGLDSNGKAKDTRTPEQLSSMEFLVKELCYIYDLDIKKDVYGHKDFANKACPSFNAKEWVESLDK